MAHSSTPTHNLSGWNQRSVPSRIERKRFKVAIQWTKGSTHNDVTRGKGDKKTNLCGLLWLLAEAVKTFSGNVTQSQHEDASRTLNGGDIVSDVVRNWRDVV